ncbi:MAG: outer membrane lipoprotein carrier protein LolA [Treponema sp.]|jgi:hypothetical protein|nr:outer membrane lipoprotein carrier protein LolA [Treponema sp.]
MKRRIMALILGVSLFAPGIAAENPGDAPLFRSPLGPGTTETFREVCSRLSFRPFIKGNFRQEKTISRLERSLVSHGKFIIASDQGIVFETLEPFPSTLAVGKDYLIQSRPGGKKTVIDAGGNETFLRLAEVISAVFSGNSQTLTDSFEVFFSGDSGSWEMGLVPRDSAIRSFTEKIYMKGDSAIRHILLNEQNGDTVLYVLSGHSYPGALSADEKALFSFF